MRRLRRTAGCLALLIVLAAALAGYAEAAGERRVALVIGNNAYANVAKLEKAVADAHAMAETLRGVGFEVMLHENLDRRGINLAIGAFVDKIASGGVGLFYFAGHGVQIGGSNYLLPVDVPAIANLEDLRDESIDLGRVMERIAEAKAKLDIMIIDACRDNPFPKPAGRSVGGTRGLTIPSAPSGLLVVYSAGVNESAIDTLGPGDRSPNGLFTRELIPFIKQPGLRLYDAVREARKTVAEKAKAAGGSQNPAIYDQTDGDFYFVAATQANKPAATSPPPAPVGAAPAPETIELAYWNSIQSSSDPDAFASYLAKYPNGSFADLAKLKLRDLKGGAPSGRTAAGPPPASDASSGKGGALALAAPPVAPSPSGQAMRCPVPGTVLTLDNGNAIRALSGEGLVCNFEGRHPNGTGTEFARFAMFWAQGAPIVRNSGPELAKLWPLKVGNSVLIRITDGGKNFNETRTLTTKVVRQERVAVRAGSFDAFVVETVEEGTSAAPFHSVATWWWAPDPGYFVKFTHVLATGGKDQSHSAWELVALARK
jgi:Caspase domain